MLQNLEEDKLMKLGVWSGAFSFLMCLLILFHIPLVPAISHHSGLNFTLLSLELARTPEEVFGVLGRPGDLTLDQRVFSYLRVIDISYLFTFLYTLYSLTLFETATRMFAIHSLIRAFVYLIFIVVISSNVYENFLLNEILSSGLNNFQINALERLHPVSMLKWISFFSVLSVIGVLLWLGSRFYFLKACGFLLFFPFVLSWFAYKRLLLIEIGLVLIIPAVSLFWFYFAAKMIKLNRNNSDSETFPAIK